MNKIEKVIHRFELLKLLEENGTIDSEMPESIKLAIEALQEKQEHEDGCEWCTNDITPNMNDFSEMFGYQPNCCPMCGRKLGEKL